ncbi:fractalkine [Dasypus novemcinctus]|uniref:fractalkine n=1 Tax=Dasypus novemcinctus TaxID=9361 RepID=UPI00265DC77F|nr:fractalkine [Dasypus novemcinctus]
MTPPSLSWLLCLAALCHLPNLLTGQQHGVKKCSIICDRMTSKIPVAFLLRYRQNQESCGRSAIVLETKKNRLFCADPKEKWVQEALELLDRQAAARAGNGNGGTFEKQIGGSEPRARPAARGASQDAVPGPEAMGQRGGLEPTPSQEMPTALGMSPEPPTGMFGPSGTGSVSASKARDGGSPAGPSTPELPGLAAASTATAWQSSAADQRGSGLWAEGKASGAPSTKGPSTEAPSTEAPSTEDHSTESSSVSRPVPEDNIGSEDQTVWAKELGPPPENSLGPEEVGSIPAHTDAFLDWGPGSLAPVSSEGASSREPGASGSWTPGPEEPVHATVDPQRLGVLITPVPDARAATQRQAVGLLAFLGFLFCLGVVMFAYQSLQGCPRKVAGEMVEGLRYVPRSCGSNSYVLVPV